MKEGLTTPPAHPTFLFRRSMIATAYIGVDPQNEHLPFASATMLSDLVAAASSCRPTAM